MRYPEFKANWTVKGCSTKIIAYDFKDGPSEERYVISPRVYESIKLADGTRTVTEIEAVLGYSPNDYYEKLCQDGLLHYSNTPSDKGREWGKLYEGKDHLARALIHLTSKCNANCKHCYMGGINWGQEMSSREITDLIKQLEEMNCYAVSLTGGEPLFVPNIVDIVKEFNNREIKVEGIFTNGTLITKSLIEQLLEIQDTPIFVSINGPKIEMHEKFMGLQEAFDLITQNLKLLQKMGVKTYANTSLTAIVNDDEKIKEFYSLIKDLGIYRWRLSRPFPQGNWLKYKDQFEISFEEELVILEKIFDLWIVDGKPFDLELGHILRYIDGEPRFMDYQDNDYVCDYYRDRITIMPNGDITACPMLITPPYVCGNIREQSLKEIWEGDTMRYYKNLRIKDFKPQKCKECPSFSECGLGCRACAVLNGLDYEDLDPEACATYTSQKYSKLKEKIYNNLKE